MASATRPEATERSDKRAWLLQAVARTIREVVRETDVPARIVGDEFVVLLPETGAQEAEAAIGKLSQHLREAMQSEGWAVMASTGVVSYKVPPANAGEMIGRADALMYAKGERKEAFDSSSWRNEDSTLPNAAPRIERAVMPVGRRLPIT